MIVPNRQQQKTEWKRKGWSIPDLRGKKQEWFQIVLELVVLLSKSPAADLNLYPNTTGVTVEYPWRVYAPFLKGLGLISNRSGVISLTAVGEEFAGNLSKNYLATLLHDKYRLFGETLDLINQSPKTIEEVDKELCREYNLDWANLSNTRRRMDWLEVLDLIECIGNRKWGVTTKGLAFLEKILLVSSNALEPSKEEEITITEAPYEIYKLLQELIDNPELHKKRNTYNIWVPSPNRIENLRTIVQFSYEKVSRSDLFKFIEEEFGLKTSSVESMMPFMKADGLLEEVGRNIYIATSAAKAWCESGNDLDFIRILHSHKRFVGEIISATEKDRVRNDVYAEAKKHGLNSEKTRWIIGFLMEAGLIEEPQYLHLKATPLGMKFIEELPLFNANYEDEITESAKETDNKEVKNSSAKESEKSNILFEFLRTAARDPMAAGKASGLAFEEAIAEVFRYMGYDAKHIGGSGETDVVVRWKNNEGKTITAVVDGKSKTSGSVAHSDISDVALETHKEKNDAEFVAIIGPSFSGDTIKNHARKKGFALVTDSELIDIAKSSKTLGLSLTDIAHLFKVPNGLSHLDELITARKRELDIITLVVATFVKEQGAIDSLSARDLYFLLRSTNLSPSLEELLNTFEMLSKEEVGILSEVKNASAAENITYSMIGGEHSVNRLRAIASAIENGLL